MAPMLAGLAAQGLNILVNAITAKGKDVIEEKLGVKLPPDGNLSSEEVLKLKQLEFEHEEWLIDAGIRQAQQTLEETKAYLADVGNARQMQVAALGQDDVFSKRFIYYLASGCLSFTGLYIIGVTFLEIPKENVRFADTVLGFLLGTMVATIIAYFFGSSRQSQGKDTVISTLMDAVTGNRRKGGQP